MLSHEFNTSKFFFRISFFPGGKKFLILLQVSVVGDKRNQTLLPLPSLALLLTRTQKVMHIPVFLPSAVCAGEVGKLLSLSLRDSAAVKY